MNGEYRKALGQVIREKRQAAKLSKQQLALMAGVSRFTLRKIEVGEANPTISLLLRIVQALGTSFADVSVQAERMLADDSGDRLPIPAPTQPSFIDANCGYYLTRL